MSEPSVCAVMLTCDRPEMARRAVECFRAQTYGNKRLEVLESAGVDHHGNRKTIGYLRNRANRAAAERDTDILIHWDDDDYSHPNRIAEQVALLQSSGAEAVGYDQMLFWRTDNRCEINGTPEAWLYTGSALGTSLCYWRRTWQRLPFPDTSYGEDSEWLKRVKCKSVSSYGVEDCSFDLSMVPVYPANAPRMVARIHGGNTSSAYDPETMAAAPHHWRRVPEWDTHCERTMKL